MKAKLFLLIVLVSVIICGALHAENATWDDSYVYDDEMLRGNQSWDIVYKGDYDLFRNDSIIFCVGIIRYKTIAEEDGDIDHEGFAYGYYATLKTEYMDCENESDLKQPDRPGILFLHGDPLRGSLLLASYLSWVTSMNTTPTFLLMINAPGQGYDCATDDDTASPLDVNTPECEALEEDQISVGDPMGRSDLGWRGEPVDYLEGFFEEELDDDTVAPEDVPRKSMFYTYATSAMRAVNLFEKRLGNDDYEGFASPYLVIGGHSAGGITSLM